MSEHPDPEYLTAAEVARVWRMSPGQVRNKHTLGTLPVSPIKLGGRLLFPADEVRAHLEHLKATRSGAA